MFTKHKMKMEAILGIGALLFMAVIALLGFAASVLKGRR